MAMNKIERLDREIQKTREKITEYQNKLKELTAQKTEAKTCKSSSLCGLCALPPQELTAMLSGDAIPGMVALPEDSYTEEQEDAANEE